MCTLWPNLTLTILLYDESSSVRHVRRMFHPGRGLGGPRARRTNMHFTSGSTGGLSSSSSQSSTYTPSNREAMDPIAGEHQEFTHNVCKMQKCSPKMQQSLCESDQSLNVTCERCANRECNITHTVKIMQSFSQVGPDVKEEKSTCRNMCCDHYSIKITVFIKKNKKLKSDISEKKQK